MGKKKKPKPKAGQVINSKLIVPGTEAGRKSQLLVPGGGVGKSSTRLSIPGAEQAAQPTLVTDAEVAAEQGDHFTVINEDTGEAVVEESAPVKITAMVPPPEAESEAEYFPPIEEQPIEPVAPVAMVAPTEAEEVEGVDEYAQPEYAAAEEYSDQGGQAYESYETPAEEYADPAQVWEQPAEEQYYDPAQYAPVAEPAPLPPPTLAPPQPPPPLPQAPPYGYGPPPGYQTQGMAPGQMYPTAFGPTRSVPSWALILVGALGGFLAAMVIFKFTGMGAALRGDLIEEGRQKAEKRYDAQILQLKDDGYGEVEEDEEVIEDPDTDTGSEAGEGAEPESDVKDGDGAGSSAGAKPEDAGTEEAAGVEAKKPDDAKTPDPPEEEDDHSDA
jgi:hypothetical protein